MLLNGLLCSADILVFFLSVLLMIMSLFKPKNGDTRIQGRRIESGCMGLWLFVFIALFAICNWTSYLTKLFSPGNEDIIKFSWIVIIIGSIIIMILLGRGNAYQLATHRVLYILGIVGIEGSAGGISAGLGASIGYWNTDINWLEAANSNLFAADTFRVYLTGFAISLAIGIFFICISIFFTQSVDINILVFISWIVAVIAGGAIGSSVSMYGGKWAGLFGGIIGIVAGFISFRKFLKTDYLDALKFERLSKISSRWDG